ncbi:hypothetical protein LCGC14_0983370 [marine sediment metagenome]|uniref:Uncharacterized protein n=1 Tax=marine sediment metagenome TaxID=412755 RepID=A0A0F9REJ2_9ZZZZ
MPATVPTMHETWREDTTGIEVVVSLCGDTKIFFRERKAFEAGDLIDERECLPRAEFLERYTFKTGAYDAT